MIKNEALFYTLLKEAEVDFKGWDFSYLNKTNRMSEFPLKWNYMIEVLNHLPQSNALLDMGTGGGEFLSTLPVPKDTKATEGYKPNVDIAKNRLEPLGIKVYEINNDCHLPFQDDEFDLIINRHESFNAKEVKRILKPNGRFITQQVGGKNDQELNSLFQVKESEYASWSLQKAVDDLLNEGFKCISKKETITKTRFYDIGAIIYYLKAIPWQIPDFSISSYKKQLINIHNLIQDEGYLDVTCHRFFVIVKK